MIEEFYIYNGILKKSTEMVLSISNRAFQYGDGFFETIFAFNNKVPFLKQHLHRVQKAMTVFQFISFDLFADADQLETMIVYLSRKNKLYKAYRVKLSIFRNIGGYYSPTDNSISYTIQTTPLPYDKFSLNNKGLIIDIYRDLQKDYSFFSEFKTNNSLIYVFASKYAKSKQLDDVLLLNSSTNIVESTSSNIFLYSSGVILTPRIADGCVNGIMRHLIIYTIKELGIDIEERIISESDLIDSDELFLTNSIVGVRYISSYLTHRYVNFVTKRILSRFNELFF